MPDCHPPPRAKSAVTHGGGWIDFDKDGVLDPYEDPSRPVEERVEDLLKRMTLEEKLEQLRSSFEIGALGNLSIVLRSLPPREGAQLANEIQRKLIEGTRLGIPTIIHDECLHGCMAKYSTQFPQAIALAATWDPDLVYSVAKAIAREARARGVRQCLAPVVNLSRDVRAGRTEETYGEDPYLASIMGSAYCRALREEGVVATPKHFVANFEADGGRDSHEAHFSERILREVFLPPFRACVKAGALSVMAAYNSLDGIPCSCNCWLLTDVLRREWGFEGFVVSDYGSVAGIITHHRVADSKELASKLALEAGLDVELPAVDVFGPSLERAVREGWIPVEVVDEAVRRVLRVKFLIGLFDEPFVDPEEAERIVGCEEHRKLALEAARRAIVLLRNDGVLPLDRSKVRRIAVLGPYSDELPLGGYSGEPARRVTPLEAIREKVGAGTTILHAKGCAVSLEKPAERSREFWQAVEIAKQADVAVIFAGIIEGEGKDRASLRLPGAQEDLINEVLKAGVPTIVVLMTGSAVVGEWIERVNALIQAWYPGQEGGRAIADVLFGDYNPGGRLPFTWPRHEGQLPLYYNLKPSGRGYDYVDTPGRPLFPFGHGLSYTKFEYRSIEVRIGEGERRVEVSVKLKNVGDREGDEVVQLYVRDAVSSVARPLRELRGFKRVTLKPGEEAEVKFELTPDDLAMYDRRMRRVVEPGEFVVMVGSSSDDIKLTSSFKIARLLAAKVKLEGVEVERRDGSALVRARVRNEGEVTDVVRVELRLEGEVADVYPMELAPGECRSAVFYVKDAEGKTIGVAVNGSARRPDEP